MSLSVIRRSLLCVLIGACTVFGHPEKYRVEIGVLAVLQAVRHFASLNDRCPHDLDELVGEGQAEPSFLVDQWGNRYSYRVVGPLFELYSNGPDGVPRTTDDVWWDQYRYVDWDSVWNTAPVGLSADRWTMSTASDRAEYRLLDLHSAIGAFFDSRREYPTALDEIIPFLAGGSCSLDHDAFADPWGQRFHYRATESGYSLFSSGPDGLPMTGDDIRVEVDYEACPLRPVRYWATDGAIMRRGWPGSGCSIAGSY